MEPHEQHRKERSVASLVAARHQQVDAEREQMRHCQTRPQGARMRRAPGGGGAAGGGEGADK